VGYVACIQSFGKKNKNPEGNMLLGRCWQRWEDSNKVYLEEIGWEGVDFLCMCQI
jgi:hypothetical protein